jgi:hypothetical protein
VSIDLQYVCDKFTRALLAHQIFCSSILTFDPFLVDFLSKSSKCSKSEILRRHFREKLCLRLFRIIVKSIKISILKFRTHSKIGLSLPEFFFSTLLKKKTCHDGMSISHFLYTFFSGTGISILFSVTLCVSVTCDSQRLFPYKNTRA